MRGKGKLSEKDVDTALREVRLALLEADVSYKVVKQFTASLKERALGAEVLKSLTPGQQVVKIVHAELIKLMGETQSKISPVDNPPGVVMMVGLQGSGKTTSAAKLARLLKKNGHKPLLAAGDVYRPAAIKQLEVLGKEIAVPVFSLGKEDPVIIVSKALREAAKEGNDYIFKIPPAGYSDKLMDELLRLRKKQTRWKFCWWWML